MYQDYGGLLCHWYWEYRSDQGNCRQLCRRRCVQPEFVRRFRWWVILIIGGGIGCNSRLLCNGTGGQVSVIGDIDQLYNMYSRILLCGQDSVL